MGKAPALAPAIPKGYHLEYGYSCMGYDIAGGLAVKMADPSWGVDEGDLAILERLAQTALLTGSQPQPHHRSFRPACGNPQESGGASAKSSSEPG